MDNKIRKLFDFQRFEGNERLNKLILETESREKRELSEEELNMVSAAGMPNLGPLFSSKK